MRFTRKLNTFEGVAAGQTATLRLPTGLTYHQILIGYTGVTLAQIEEITVVANGKPIQTFRSGTEIDNRNKFDKRAASTDGLLVIDFERFGILTRAGREHTALGTGMPRSASNPHPITTLELQIQVAAAAVGTAFTAKAIQSAGSDTGVIKKVRTFTYDPAGAGDYEISDLPKTGTINRIFFDHANVDEVTIESDGYVIYQRTRAENTRVQNDGERLVNATTFAVDPSELGYTGEGIATRYGDGREISDLRFRLNMSAAATVPVTVEYLDELGN